MSGSYVLWTNFGMGWNQRLVGSWDATQADRARYEAKGGRCLTTFCPPGHTPRRDDLMVHL